MTQTPSSLTELRRRVADLLDRVLVRQENGYAAQQKLKALSAEFDENGGEEISKLLARAQGIVGMVNVSPYGDPLHQRALDDLTTLKQELRSLARNADPE